GGALAHPRADPAGGGAVATPGVDRVEIDHRLAGGTDRRLTPYRGERARAPQGSAAEGAPRHGRTAQPLRRHRGAPAAVPDPDVHPHHRCGARVLRAAAGLGSRPRDRARVGAADDRRYVGQRRTDTRTGRASLRPGTGPRTAPRTTAGRHTGIDGTFTPE